LSPPKDCGSQAIPVTTQETSKFSLPGNFQISRNVIYPANGASYSSYPKITSLTALQKMPYPGKFDGVPVTVMIPAYNAESSIRETIESVLNQTVKPGKIVVVDDGSTDGTRAIIESYGDRVHLMVQKNQGPSVARNWSIGTIESDFVSFVDADDIMEPTRMEKQLKAFAETPDAVLCYNGMRQFNDQGFLRDLSAPPLDTLKYHLRFHNPGITPSTMMVRRSTYLEAGGFNTSLRGIEDWEFLVRVSRVGPFCVVDEPLTLYRVSDASLSSHAERIYQEVERMVDSLLLDGLSGISRWVWRRRILSFQAMKAAFTLRASDKTSEELHYLLKSIATWPSPFWTPIRFAALAVTLRNMVLRSKRTQSSAAEPPRHPQPHPPSSGYAARQSDPHPTSRPEPQPAPAPVPPHPAPEPVSRS
jgi:glycosyltransferase involved in cell wall biosynthesis